MAQRHRLSVAHGFARGETNGEMDPWRDDGFRQLVLSPSGYEALDRVLQPFGQTAEVFLLLDALTRSRSNMPDPAAVIIFPRNYWLAGHVLELRGRRTDVNITYCSYKPGDAVLEYPPVSVIYVPDREIFGTLAERSPMLNAAWDLVRDTARSDQWLCIADPLPEPWASEAERTDRALFASVRMR